jgi:MFS family permease
MRLDPLSPGEIERARKSFFLYAVLNVISFTLLGGNIITLYSLRLGASNFLIGLLSSFMYLAYLFMLLGRLLAPKWGMVRLMGRFWVLRYLLMLPILLSPALASRGYREHAYALIIFSVLAFNMSRGLAITGYNPILGAVAAEKDRGAFLARLQALQQTVTLGLGIAMAVILGREAPLSTYALFIMAGIATGLVGASVIFRFPEPPRAQPTLAERLGQGLGQAFAAQTFRRFILLYFLTTLASYMVQPFLVVYMKQVYHRPDDAVLYFTVFSSLGAVLMALASGFMIDRLGAKPLYILFFGILAPVLAPLVVAPRSLSAAGVWVFGALVFLFYSMGQSGMLNAGQTYFLAAIKPEERLNLGVAYYMTLGLAGGLGSIIGGAVLQWLGDRFAGDVREAFQIYFGAVGGLMLLLLFPLNSLESLGAVPIWDALAAIFSPRDLRAISLLNRLSRTRSLTEEMDTLRALADAPSGLSAQEVLGRLRSPRFGIRSEALRALGDLPLEEAAVQALLSEVKNHPFTTAYMAAELLGRRRVRAAVPALRAGLRSKDFFLQGKAMVALAQLDDRRSVPAIRAIVAGTNNPRLLIHGATALELFRDAGAFSLLLGRLKGPAQPHVRDEIILSLAGILGMGEWFYPIYSAYLERAGTGISMLRDAVESGQALRIPRELLTELLQRLPGRNHAYFAALAAELLDTVRVRRDGVDVSAHLRRAVLDRYLARLDRLLLLTCAVIVRNAVQRREEGPGAASA